MPTLILYHSSGYDRLSPRLEALCLEKLLGLDDVRTQCVSEPFDSDGAWERIYWVGPELGNSDSLWEKLFASALYRAFRSKTWVVGAQIEGTGLTESLEQLVKNDRLGLLDTASKKCLAQWGGEGHITGLPSFHWAAEPLTLSRPRPVFSPPPFHGNEHAPVLDFYRRLPARALFLAQEQSDFAWRPDPGVNTFHSPRFPEHHLVACASAELVVSGRATPVLAALAAEVPAYWLALGKSKTPAWVKDLGVPVLTEVPSADFRKAYPWKKIHACRKEWRENLDALVKKTKAASGKKADDRHHLHLCSTANSAYAVFLFGFIENAIRAHRGPITFHILALDRDIGAQLTEHYPDLDLRIHYLEDLWNETELPRILSRSVGHRAFSSKSRLLSLALKEARKPVYYCDCDVYFFETPYGLGEAFGEQSVLLFPHWNDTYPAARFDGLFNAGMVACAPGAEPFLQWWDRLCLQESAFDMKRGMVGDQAYLDFAPLLFDFVKVYRGMDHNIARWNMHSLTLRLEQGRPVIGPGKPVKTYHAAFGDEQGVYEAKFCWDQLAAFFCGLDNPDKFQDFLKTILFQQTSYWLDLSRARNLHKNLSTILRRPERSMSLSWARAWVQQWPGRLLKGAIHLRALLKGQKAISAKDWAPLERPSEFWIQQQRETLEALHWSEPPSDAKKSRKAS